MWLITLCEISVGAVVLAAWIAFGLLGLGGSLLHLAVACGWAVLPPPNRAIGSTGRRAALSARSPQRRSDWRPRVA